MSSFTNDSALGWGDGRNPRGHTSTSRQQHAPVTGNSLSNESHWIDGPLPESYMPTGLAPFTSSWTGTAFPDPLFSASLYGGGVWQGRQDPDSAYLEALFGPPGGNTDGPGIDSFTAMGVAVPVSEQAFPVVQRALPSSQLSLNRVQAHGPPWQPTPWDHPMRTVTQQGDHGSSIGSLGMGPEIHVAPSSLITGPPECGVMSTGRISSMAAPHPVRPLTQDDPVSAAQRGERWDPTFQCLWGSSEKRCRAVIAGNRRSVTSHLREEHDFACDGQTIACAWDSCTACMQRRNIPRHIVGCHFEIKVTCNQCGMALSRADANKKHQLVCTGGTKAPALEESEEDHGRLFF